MTITAHCIVIAWPVVGLEPDDAPYARDLGHRPTLRSVTRGCAVVWLLAGSEGDVEAAERYARERGEGARVFCYPEGEADPLGRARREVVAPAMADLTDARKPREEGARKKKVSL